MKNISLLLLPFFLGCKSLEDGELSGYSKSASYEVQKKSNHHKLETWVFNKDYVLGINDSIFNTKNNLGFSLIDVLNESRCPKGVTCIHGGSVDVKLFSFNDLGVKIDEFVLKKEAYEEGEDNVYANNHFRIKLLKVKPYPIVNKAIPLEQYTVSIKILNK